MRPLRPKVHLPSADDGKSSTTRWRQKVSSRHRRIREIYHGLLKTGREAHQSIVEFEERDKDTRHEAVEPEGMFAGDGALWDSPE